MASCLFYLCKVQSAMQQLISDFFWIAIDSIYPWLCVQNKWGFFWSCETVFQKRYFSIFETVFQKRKFSIVCVWAISPRSLVTKNEVPIQVDCSESYGDMQQREIQSAYFGHFMFGVFTACFCLRDAENKILRESVTISSVVSCLHYECANHWWPFERKISACVIEK